MNARFLFVLSAVLAISIVTPAEAGWGSGGCSNGSCAPPAAVAASSELRWEYHPEHQQSWLFRGQLQIAGWDHECKTYRTRDAAGVWSDPKPPPWACSCANGDVCSCDDSCACDGCPVHKGSKGHKAKRKTVKADPAPCADGCDCERCADGCKCGRGNPCGEGCPCVTKAAKAKREKIAVAIQFLDAQYIAGDLSEAEYVKRLDPLWIELTGQPHGPLNGEPTMLVQADIPNYGLDLSKIGEGGEKSSINGRTVTKRQLLQALGEPVGGDTKIPDDAGLLRLTIVADDAAALAKVRASLAPALGDLTSKLVIQWYTKDAWPVRPEYGFRFDALPAALLQAPEQPGQRGGRALLQAAVPNDPGPLVAAVRQKIDSYDPKKAPGLPGGPMNIPPAAVAGGLALAAIGFLVLKK